MSKPAVTVNVQMDAKTFKRFALFDTFSRRQRLRAPAIFCGLFLAFAAVAYSQLGRAEQAGLIGGLLLLLGLGLPFVYVLHYYLQLNAQVRRLGIKKPRPAYFVTLNEDGVRVVNNMAKEQPVTLPWADLFAAYRRADAVYLYHTESRAFILPVRDASVSLGTLWDTISTHMPKEKLHA